MENPNAVTTEVATLLVKLEAAEDKSYQKALGLLSPRFSELHPQWYMHRGKAGGDKGLLEIKKTWGHIEKAFIEQGGNASTFRSRRQRMYDIATKTFDPETWEQMLEARLGKRERLTFHQKVVKQIIPPVKAALEDENAPERDMDFALELKRVIELHGYKIS